MQYRRLGRSELVVSEIGLGSWRTFGVGIGREQSRACIREAFEHGINFFDTANMYGRGAAETVLGEVLQDYARDSYVLASKVYFPMSDHDRGLSRAQIKKQLDASLRRLKTDHLDLYQCHRYDHDTPLEETMEALSESVLAGKVRYIGFSEWSPRRIRAARALCPGVEPFVSSQPQYSLLYRKPERDVFPLCAEFGIGQIAWSPLAQGVLTGKYPAGGAAPARSRLAKQRAGTMLSRFTQNHVLQAVQQLVPIAERLSLTMPQLALAWVLKNMHVASAIIGASRPEQIAQNAAAVGVALGPAALQEIDCALDGAVRT